MRDPGHTGGEGPAGKDFGTPAHASTPLTLPARMRPTTAAIDARLVPLVARLWRLGYVPTHCCQGDGDESGRAALAYISFRSLVEAALFVAQAGPVAWDPKTHRQRHAENPQGTERWTWDWHVEGAVVRFPTRDIGRATAAINRRGARLEALVGAVSASPIPRLPAPPACPQCGMELMGAFCELTVAHRPAPLTCPTCGGVVLSRRKDARYCSRKC